MFTLPQIRAALRAAHKPELAKQPGLLCQVWEDGEITLQKSGELLWQRSLHMIEVGLSSTKVPVEDMPDKYEDGTHGWVCVGSIEDARIIRDMINSYAQRTKQEG